VPIVAIGFNWKRANRIAANTSVISGLACYAGLYLTDIRLPYDFHQGAFSMLITLTIFFMVALVTPANRLDKDIDAVMDL
jgi:Na+/pantothenate symporter